MPAASVLIDNLPTHRHSSSVLCSLSILHIFPLLHSPFSALRILLTPQSVSAYVRPSPSSIHGDSSPPAFLVCVSLLASENSLPAEIVLLLPQASRGKPCTSSRRFLPPSNMVTVPQTEQTDSLSQTNQQNRYTDKFTWYLFMYVNS
jgi:hypothetical protein